MATKPTGKSGAAASKSGAITTANPGAITAPAFIDEAEFGAGFEGADKSSYAIPFIQILQKMSPLVDEDNPKHIEGAKAGMLYNTVTQELYDGKEGITIIPCGFRRSFIRWGPRDGEGGFKGEVRPEDVDKMVAEGLVKNVDGKFLVPDSAGEVHEKKSDYYADTRSHFVLLVNPKTKEISGAILSLSSTQIKASKMLMTSLQQRKLTLSNGTKRTPPTFANLVKLTTQPQANDKGSWSGAKFEMEGFVTDAEVYQMAKDFYSSFLAGDLKADYAKTSDLSGDASVSGTAAEAETF